MIDRFDEAFDPPAQPARPSRAYDVAPPGEHVAEIVGAEYRPVPWCVSPDNPHGTCLSLRLRIGPDYAFVFDDLPDDRASRRMRLAQAVGINVEACVPEELVGRTVRVQLSHVPTRAGGFKAVVRRWVRPPPVAQPQPQRQSPTLDARTATLVDAINDWARQPPPARSTNGRRSRNAVKRHVQDDDGIPF